MFNPYSNSIKDRVSWYMFIKAIQRGLRIEKLYEATSTNTGMALAAIHGLKS